MSKETAVLNLLEKRRRDLVMSYADLARRSGVCAGTVQRALASKNATVSFAHVAAIAEALGASVTVDQQDPLKVLTEQARHKAEKIVGMVQGSSGLEGQAVDQKTFAEMVSAAAATLLRGSRRALWGA